MLTTEQMKNLLKHYSEIPAKIKAIEVALRHIGADSDIEFYGSCVSQSISDMPFMPAGNVSSKVQDTVQSYDKKMQDAKCDHARAIAVLGYIHEQISVSLIALNETERVLVEHCVIGDKPMGVLVSTFKGELEFMSQRTRTRKRDNAVEKLRNVVIIDGKQYKVAAAALNIVDG